MYGGEVRGGAGLAGRGNLGPGAPCLEAGGTRGRADEQLREVHARMAALFAQTRLARLKAKGLL